MEKGGVADHIHIGMILNKLPQTLFGMFSGFWLTHIKCQLVFKIFPVIGDCIVHMYRIPDQICQKTYRIIVVSCRLFNGYGSILCTSTHPAKAALRRCGP